METLVSPEQKWTGFFSMPASKEPNTQCLYRKTVRWFYNTSVFLNDFSRLASIKLGINMAARVERTVRRSDSENQLVGEPTGEFYDVILYFGVIDILQDYDISKKLEHAYKSMQYDPTSISAVDPKQYSRRFRDFIFRVFVEDT